MATAAYIRASSTRSECPIVFDRILAGIGLAILSPSLALVAIAIFVEDGLPILFLQKRVGRAGRPFSLFKFRSMRIGMAGADITGMADPRVTRLGRLLRKYKIDELPQLWNVLRGEMRFVGPRPEVPHFVDLKDPVWQGVLQVRPGITDLASLIYRNEEELLGTVPDIERYYSETVQPHKLALNLHYIQNRTWLTDIRIILQTIRYSLLPKQFNAERISKSFLVKRIH
jgi:lipopolysaccharide/colanic/teichoic acid biosynthesis glycosyltransferase